MSEAIPAPPLPRVEITEIEANVYSGTELRIDIRGENFDAVTGYLPETGAFTGQVIVNGVDKDDQDFHRDGDVWRCEGLTSSFGEEVKVILTPVPERTDIDPTPAEATAQVMEP